MYKKNLKTTFHKKMIVIVSFSPVREQDVEKFRFVLGMLVEYKKVENEKWKKKKADYILSEIRTGEKGLSAFFVWTFDIGILCLEKKRISCLFKPSLKKMHTKKSQPIFIISVNKYNYSFS
jgi:hypothetical protein